MIGIPKLYYVNSRTRIDGTPSDFRIVLDNLSSYKYNRLTLMGASIPKAWYLIDSRHNSFILTEDGTDINITLDIGNYSALTLATLLGAVLTAESLASGNGWTYQCRFNKVNGHFIWTVSDNTSQPSFTISATDFRLARILGLQTGTHSFIADVLESTRVINLQLTNSVNILIDNIEDGVLQDIYSSNIDFTSIEFINNNPEFTGKRTTLNSNNIVRIQLIDSENLETIDMNGQDIVLTLCFYTANDFYERAIEDRKWEILQQELKLQNDELIEAIESVRATNTNTNNTI